jgi:hypothetical protein
MAVVGAIPIAFATQRWADGQRCESSSSFQREGGKEVTGNSPCVPLILGTHHRLYFCDLVVSRKKLGGGGTYLTVPHLGTPLMPLRLLALGSKAKKGAAHAD